MGYQTMIRPFIALAAFLLATGAEAQTIGCIDNMPGAPCLNTGPSGPL